MNALAYSSSSQVERAPLRRRGIAIVLTIVIHILLLLMLLKLAPQILPLGKSGTLATFDALPDRKAENERPTARQDKAKPAARKAAEAAKRQPTPVQQDAKQPPGPIVLPEGFITLSRQQYRATDLTGRQGTPSQTASADGSAEAADGGKAGGGIPGPEQLFDADWARRPTDAELSFYLPKTRRAPGWGLIACKTVPGNRVEDCKILGEGPTGSGYGRSVLQAAWQFRVLPPRIGNRPTIGAWVSIRIDYTERGATPN